MRLSWISATLSPALLLLPATARAQISRYELDVAASAAAANTMTASGGTFSLVYNLASGSSAVPSLGSQFIVTARLSDFNNTATGADNAWSAVTLGGIGNSSVGVSPHVGDNSSGSLYSGLPAANSTTETLSGTPDQAFQSWLGSSALVPLGDFTLTLDAAPTASGWNLVTDQIGMRSIFNMVISGTTTTLSGYYARYEGITGVNSTPNNASTLTATVTHGDSYKFMYTAFSNGSSFVSSGGSRPLVALSAGVLEFQAVPEPSASLLCLAGAAGLLLRRKRG